MTEKQKQSIRIALLLLILSISVCLLLKGKNKADIPDKESEHDTSVTQSERQSESTEQTMTTVLPGSDETHETSEASAESHTTSATITSTTTSASSVTASQPSAAEETTKETTVKETTVKETTVKETTESYMIAYGPFEIDDISTYDIVDPVKDYGSIDEEISLDSMSRGILRVKFTGEGEYKVRIEKGDAFYNYDLKADGNVEVFPLQMGSGSYRAMILKRIEGDRFSVIKSKRFTVELNDGNLVYLNAVQNVFWLPQMEPVSYARGPLIYEILKGGEIPGEELDIESFKALWSYIIANISYDKDKYSDLGNMAGYIPDIKATFTDRKGICYDYASLMASLLRSYGLPVKMVMGYCPAYYGEGYHAWNEVYLDGRWITVDATYDAAFFQAGYRVNFEKDASLYKKGKEY